MLRVEDRRRHGRTELVCPATLRDKRGRVLFRGRTTDVSPCGVKVVGPAGGAVSEGKAVWVEMRVPSHRSTGPRHRRVKLRGYVRRVTGIGGWTTVTVVVESDVPLDALMTGT